MFEFCQNLSQRFIECLTEEKCLSRIKKSIEWRKSEKIDSLNNEELEFDIIDSSLESDQQFQDTLARLHSLLMQYKEVIDRNVCLQNDNTFDVIIDHKKNLVFKWVRITDEEYDYKPILELIDWKSLENTIKLKFDYSSRLALIEEQRN